MDSDDINIEGRDSFYIFLLFHLIRYTFHADVLEMIETSKLMHCKIIIRATNAYIKLHIKATLKYLEFLIP